MNFLLDDKYKNFLDKYKTNFFINNKDFLKKYLHISNLKSKRIKININIETSPIMLTGYKNKKKIDVLKEIVIILLLQSENTQVYFNIYTLGVDYHHLINLNGKRSILSFLKFIDDIILKSFSPRFDLYTKKKFEKPIISEYTILIFGDDTLVPIGPSMLYYTSKNLLQIKITGPYDKSHKLPFPILVKNSKNKKIFLRELTYLDHDKSKKDCIEVNITKNYINELMDWDGGLFKL